MNYYGPKDLAASFRTVRKNTLTIAEEIGEQHYGFRPTPESRTVAQTLIHISQASRMQEHIQGNLKLNTLEGFDFMAFVAPMIAEEQKPHTKAEIVATLRDQGERFAKWMEGLSDDFLGQRVSLPAGAVPPNKTRFEMILAVKEHEMHHRGQLMLIERMIGIVPHLTREMQARRAAMTSAKS